VNPPPPPPALERRQKVPPQAEGELCFPKFLVLASEPLLSPAELLEDRKGHQKKLLWHAWALVLLSVPWDGRGRASGQHLWLVRSCESRGMVWRNWGVVLEPPN
jgi:hypothetical protein